MRTIIVLLLLALALAACDGRRESSSAQADIRDVMMRTWNRPESPLTVGPIVTVDAFAIADWTQPTMGGRALLQRAAQSWSVVLCAGDELENRALLTNAGMTEADADALLAALAAAESTVPAERLARIASFKDVIRMDAAAGAHAR